MASGGYSPEDAVLQAKVLREAAAQSSVAPIRGRLITLARELEFAAEHCIAGYEIIPVSLAQRGQRVIGEEGSGIIMGISTKNRGEYLIRGHRDKPDVQGNLELWGEYLCGGSPCVVEVVG